MRRIVAGLLLAATLTCTTGCVTTLPMPKHFHCDRNPCR